MLDDPANTDVEPLKERARRWMDRLFDPAKGLFVRVGGLPQGSGFALGPAYRQPVKQLMFTPSAVYSIHGYWEVEGKASLPHLANDRAFAAVAVRRRHLPEEDFFGLGLDTTTDMRTSYTLNETAVFADGGVKPVKWLTIGGTAEYRQPRLSAGKDVKYPSIEEVFSSATAPGLTAQANFIRIGTRAHFDFRNEAADTTGADRYLFAFDRYFDRSLGRYSFKQWTADLREFLPIADGHLIALRALATGVVSSEGQDVPFFYQPTLGGPNALRGYPSYRFRDRNVLLMQGEYRFDLHKYLIGAVFYDTGGVASTLGDLRLSEFKQDFGASLRVRYDSKIVLRIDAAHAPGAGRTLLFRFTDVF